TSNSLLQLLGSDELRKPDYTVFCITKDNPFLEFAALFLEVHIQSLYREFLTRELSKEILAIPLITMQATGTELIISISDQQALPLIR
ncbi:31931_t:CDS:2, partial [Racocetra persica]